MNKFWVYNEARSDASGPFEIADLKKVPGFGADTMVAPDGAVSVDAWRKANTYIELQSLFITPPPLPKPVAPRAPPPPPRPAAARETSSAIPSPRPQPTSAALHPLPIPINGERVVKALAVIIGLPLLFVVLAGLFGSSPNDPIPVSAHVQKGLAKAEKSAVVVGAGPAAAATPVHPPEPVRPAVDLRGYKGARWGMDKGQVSEAMATEFSPVGEGFGNGPDSPAAGNWAIRSVFYELWGVPKSQNMFGMPYYHAAFVPSKFSVYKAESGDCAVFFEGKLSAYHFESRPKNYEQLLNKLSGEYGPPTNRTVNFDHPSTNTPQESEPHQHLIHTWELGHTVLRLSRGQTRAAGMIMTEVHVIYESRDLRGRIVDQIQKAATAERAKRKNKDAADAEADLRKLQ